MGALVAITDSKGALEKEKAAKAKVAYSDMPCHACTRLINVSYPKSRCVVRNQNARTVTQKHDWMAQELAASIAMHIVATRPLCLDRKTIPTEALEGEGPPWNAMTCKSIHQMICCRSQR